MNAISKLSLYDVLSMIIPGFLLLMLFPICSNYPMENLCTNVYVGFLLFIVCYVVGLIYHKVIEKLFSFFNFRNNPNHIKKMRDKVYSDYQKQGSKIKKEDSTENFQMREYYNAYYQLMKNNMLNNIPTLEAQVAFLRNILPITIIYVIVICCCQCSLCELNTSVAISLLIVAVIVIVLLIDIQNKIYELVWEGDAYLKEIQQENKNHAAFFTVSINATFKEEVQNKTDVMPNEAVENEADTTPNEDSQDEIV